MRRLWSAVTGLPGLARWGILSLGGVVLVALIGSVVWAVLQQRETAARRAFAPVATTSREAIAGGQEAPLAGAAEALRRFLGEYPRSAVSAQAWYILGNVEYERRGLDAALAAFGEASRRDSASIGALSRLGVGYVWEAKHEPSRALDAYREALTGRDPKDFLYGELLLAVGRVLEGLQQPTSAIDTYKRFLKDLPTSPRADDVRIRLAVLGASV